MAAAAYLFFVVYGSLLPFAWRPRAFDEAWRAFLDTPFLALGVASRADWVANGILYLPLGWLLAAVFVGAAGGTGARLVRAFIVWAACEAVAFGVEFTQLFFPPRTVSLNDLLAESIGAALGVGAWLTWGAAAGRLAQGLQRGGPRAVRAAGIVYLLLYLALSLFPYDLLVAADEFSRKLANGGAGWLLAPAACSGTLFCAAKMGGEVLGVVPAGLLLGLGLASRGGVRGSIGFGLLVGGLLGAVVELAQLAIASGISQGLSVLTRALGVALGLALSRHARAGWLPRVRPWLPALVLAALLPYLLALAAANGWLTRQWGGWPQVEAGLADLHWLPLYYHYFSTETWALVSLLFCVVCYAPVGLGVAALRLRGDGSIGGSAWLPAGLAAGLAAVVEAGKLALPGRHPDPSNVFIAAAAAAGCFVLLRLLSLWLRQGSAAAVMDTPAPAPAPTAPPQADARVGPGVLRGLAAVALLGGVAVALAQYPLGAALPGVLLAALAVLLWRFPRAWLTVAMTALPALNFMPRTGWVLVDEFDLLLAVTVAVLLLRPRSARPQPTWTPGAMLAVALLLSAFLASALVGFWPLSPFNADALSGYFSGWNSLRILKGLLWPLALWWLVRDEGQGGRDLTQRFITGLLLGLCVVIAVSLWQRIVFGGLFSFSAEYRIEGPFPELHTGGGDLHAYLVLAMPFAAVAVALWRRWPARLAAAAVLAGAGFTLAVTFTRGAYVGAAGVLVVMVLALLRHRGEPLAPGGPPAAPRAGARWAAAAVVLAGLVIAVPVFTGTMMQARLASSGNDAKTRFDHWLGALALRSGDLQTTVFGMGLGSFPRTFLVGNPAGASASVSVRDERGETYARLGAGRPTYFGQHVATEPGQAYALSLDLRSSGRAAGQLVVNLCEKSEQYSFDCRTLNFEAGAQAGVWQPVQGRLDNGDMGAGRLFFRRPVVLTFSNNAAGTVVDIAHVRLLAADGHDLLRNGSFAQGSAHWFFAADDHLPWHIFNLPTQVLFELGWFGVGAVSLLLLLALGRATARMWRGDLLAGAALAALVGFLLVGITESLFDGPRVMVLFFLVVFMALQRPGDPPRARSGHRSRRRRSRSAVPAAPASAPSGDAR